MDNFVISFQEFFIIFLLIIAIFLPFNLLSKNKLTIAHPLIFYSLVMFYYTILCPIYQIVNNETISKGFDFREQYILGWQGALLSVVSVLIGYFLNNKVNKKASKYCFLNYESLWSIGLALNIIGFFLFMLFTGFDISVLNPFYSQSLSLNFLTYKGGFRNFFLTSQDFLISGNLLMFASAYSTQKKFPITLLTILISTCIFLNSGFRYRLLILFASIIIFLLLKEDKLKASLAINLGSAALVILLISMTIIGQIRTYGQGINLEYLDLTDNILKNTFAQAESSIFITTSGIINIIPKVLPFENFYPIFKTLIHPLPAAFFDKGSGDYLYKISDAVYGFKNVWHGAAYLYYGEYYLMFGWFGIFIFNFLIGNLFKRLWSWINIHKEEPLALLIYILNIVFIFMVITRGYLPQQVMLYLFIMAPVFAVYFYNLRRITN